MPVESCRLCERLNKLYPVEGRTEEQLQKAFFPGVVRRAATIDDLDRVGPGKPLGYLPVSTVIKLGFDVTALMLKYAGKGLRTFVVSQEDSNVSSGALYVFDREALARLLESRRQVLVDAGWPTDPESFVLRLKETADRKTALYDLIADAFADKTNWGRTDVSERTG